MTGAAATPSASALAAFVLFASAAAFAWRRWPAVVSEAARRALLLSFPLAGGALALSWGLPLPARAAAVASWVAAFSLFAAAGSLANAEAGWRRAAAWAGAVLFPVAAAGGFHAWLAASTSREHRVVAVAAGAVALLAWAPVLSAESFRVRRELEAEVRLGLMPEEDAAVLANPWKRWREPRFGQRDERREYVRSALLLAVAQRQQTRREGEAARLRQLEVLSFRTRLRRTLEARAGRMALGAADFPDDLG